MAYRKCRVCSGTGNLWGTPPLTESGGLQDRKVIPLTSDTPDRDFGLTVTCWRCLGVGSVLDDSQDAGAI